MRGKFIFLLAFITACVFFTQNAPAQKRPAKLKLGKICGNPNAKCRTGNLTVQSHEIPFEIPNSNTVIAESEFFYAVVLESGKLPEDSSCENIFPEAERLETQKLFPDHKVFALKCLEAGSLYYTNFADDVNFIAVYAGKTLAEAKEFLKIVKKTGKFKGANIRRTQAQINGT